MGVNLYRTKNLNQIIIMKNKLIYVALFLMAVTLGACSNWLDVAPKTEVPTHEMFSDEEGFHDALMACYVKMSSDNIYGKELTIESIEHMAQNWNRTNLDEMPLAFSNFEYTSKHCQSVIKKIYGELYNVIVQANLVNENIQTKGNVIEDKAVRDVIEGEVLAIRAFCHFDVLRLFGQLPNNATKNISLPYAETVTVVNAPYYNYTEFVKKIENDLTRAAALLKESDPALKYTMDELNQVSGTDYDGGPYLTHRRYRMNYWAVKALQARFYMYINQPAKANEMANIVINAKTPSGNKLFNLSGDNDLSKENYSLPSEAMFTLSAPEINKYGAELMKGKRTLDAGKLKNDLFKGRNIDANNRYKQIWTTHGDQLIPVIRKYAVNQDNDEGSVSSQTKLLYRQLIPILRLSEMYLIAMETSDLAAANTLYLEYMLARNEQVSPLATVELLKEEVINEYRREFWAEGQMFYLYKRLGEKTMLWKINSQVFEADYSLPLPNTEVNPNLN